MQLLLVRHGESAGNVSRRLQGRDDPLTDEQAVTFVCRDETGHLSPEPDEVAALGQVPE